MLADLAVGRLAERLEQVAFGELPPTSPRLRKLLREHGVVADRCQAGAPSTLEQAASNMPCGAFGEPTQRVAREYVGITVIKDIFRFHARTSRDYHAAPFVSRTIHVDVEAAPGAV